MAMRFFFDCASEETVIFDYAGYEFQSSRSAIEFAQQKLMLLKYCFTRDWTGWSIEVSDAYGAKLCSLPIDAPEMMIVADGFTDVFIFPSHHELH
jgi:hypothetical protein